MRAGVHLAGLWSRAALLSVTLALSAIGVGAMSGAQARSADQVRAAGRLVISVYSDFAPWAFSENGELKGIDVEIGRLLARDLGVMPEFMVRMAGEDVDGDLRANVWRGDIVEKKVADVMMHVPVDPGLAARNDLVVICCRYQQSRMAVAFDPDEVPVHSYAAFRSRRIAVELDSTADIWLSAAFNGLLVANIDRGRTFEVAAERFLSGAVPALMAPRDQLEWAMRTVKRSVSIEEWPMLGVIRSSWPIGLAVKIDGHDLAYELEDALQKAMTSGELAAIYARYGVTWRKPEE